MSDSAELHTSELHRAELHRTAIAALEALGLAGVTHLPAVDPPALGKSTSSQQTSSRPAAAKTSKTGGSVSVEAGKSPATAAKEQSLLGTAVNVPKLSLAEATQALKILADEVSACTACEELASTRTQTVFGVGNPQARLCFMGEAPGADEDRQGEPFVGRAGQLLTKIIEACTLRREDVYILNTLKCRPPGNRNPSEQEAANCRTFLDRQLEIIQPEYICCLGAVAAQNLLGTTQSIGRLRGKLHSAPHVTSAQVMCTYHPAYLLRNPAAKRDVWNDMQFLMAEMGIELPHR